MDAETEKYLRGKKTGGLLVYIENSWGVRVSIAVDLLWLTTTQPRAHVTVTVPNAIHRLELFDPPPLSRTYTLNASADLGSAVNDALIRWIDALEGHIDSASR